MTPKAGRELDALVAEKVMGFNDGPHTLYAWHDRKKRENPLCYAFYGGGDGIGDFTCYANEAGEKLFCGRPKRVFWPDHYSTEIGAAWEVVEKMFTIIPQQDIHLEHLAANQAGDEAQWSVSTCFENEAWVGFIHADTAPHAICLAALKAVE